MLCLAHGGMHAHIGRVMPWTTRQHAGKASLFAASLFAVVQRNRTRAAYQELTQGKATQSELILFWFLYLFCVLRRLS